jgi:hypothetical protein
MGAKTMKAILLKGRHCLTAMLFALISGASHAQLSGPLSGTLTPGSYTVTGNISVQEGDSLLIEPGVHLLFAGLYSFEIYGHLHASGTEQDSIVFSPLDSTIQWAGIKFYSPTPDPSLLKYCFLSGSSNSGVYCHQSNPIFDRCTIRDNSSTGHGGGMDIENASPLISNCTIRRNFSQSLGGGIALRQCPNAILEHCIIDSNDSDEGDGMGLYCYLSDPLIRYCAVNGNERGGTRLENSNPTLFHCTFTGNGSEAIFMLQSNPTLDYCIFTQNLIGIQLLDSNPSVFRCIFQGNQLFGIDCHHSYPTISFCVVKNNYTAGVQVFSDAHPMIHAATICANGGSGIYCPDGGSSCLNCIIAGNAGYGIEFGYGDEVHYCDIWGNGEGVYQGTPPPEFALISTVNANGDSCDIYFNIFEDPAFVDTTWGDYRLQWGSPCIDAGDPDPHYIDPDGTMADMGAFYYDQDLPVRILLTPHNAPIQIPAAGGSFAFTIWLTNIDPSAPQIVVWIDVTLPDGAVVGPVLGPVSTSLDSGITISRERTQNVPSGAPEGIYTYNAYAVAGPDTSFDSFPFFKLESDGSDGSVGWENTSESFNKMSEALFAPTVPNTYSLSQNYPNPFNASTTLRFNLPATCNVKLIIFDIAGRPVATLVDGYRQMGAQEVTFDASRMSSGVYLYRLRAGDFCSTGKMVLMK